MTTRLLAGIALAAFTLTGSLATSQTAKAEDLVNFLWGGSEEFGGGRQVTSFSPQYKPGQIIVSFSDRRLYLITSQGKAITYPVAVPTGEARWQGVTVVSNKRINPAWTPTPEMVHNNPRLPRWVPGGHPMNPLGVRAMYLGSSAYRIHGTDAPWTIGQAVSHGCIRMTNKDVLDLYPRVPVGMRVTVTWQSFSGHPIASNEPLFGGDEQQSRPSGNGAQASYANYDDDAQTDDGYPATSASASPGGGAGLSIWDQEERRPRAEKKKVAKETTSKKSRSESGSEVAAVTKTTAAREEAAVAKASPSSDEKPKAAKAAAAAEEKADVQKASVTTNAAKPEVAKSATASVEKASVTKPATATETKSPAPETKSAAAPETKPVAKNYKAVSDPVAVKKPVAGEPGKSSSGEKTPGSKSDKTASAQ